MVLFGADGAWSLDVDSRRFLLKVDTPVFFDADGPWSLGVADLVVDSRRLLGGALSTSAAPTSGLASVRSVSSRLLQTPFSIMNFT